MAAKKPKTFADLFKPAQQDEFLQLLRDGLMRGAAIDVVLGPGYRKAMREYVAEHAEFEELVLDAEVDATEHSMEALYQASISGNVAATKAWLELRGVMAAPQRGRPPKEKESEGEPSDPFSELDNVTRLDPRQRRG